MLYITLFNPYGEEKCDDIPSGFYSFVGIFNLQRISFRIFNLVSQLTWNNLPSGEYVETDRSYPVPIDDMVERGVG
jgi:hypothetical protein